MTGRELVTATLRLIGAVAPGESIASSEAVDGLAAINRMLSSWSNEKLTIYVKEREAFALTGGVQSYTIGTSGTFNTDRPLKIESASISVSSSGAVEYPLRILNLTEWNLILEKGTSSNIPTDLYVDNDYPLATINLYPKPSTAYYLILYSLKPLTSISTLDSSVSFPPGYEEAIIYNGAIRLAPEYGKQVSEAVALIAQESKANIKRSNYSSIYLRADNALLVNKRFNFETGDDY